MPKHSVLLALSTATLTLAGCLADAPADEPEASSGSSGEQSSGEQSESDPEVETDTPTTGDEANDPRLEDARSCTPGELETCAYGGPARNEGVGACAAAVRVCGEDGEWGACAGEVLPRAEDCRNQTDDDCDGRVACDGKIEWVRGIGEGPDGSPGTAGVYGLSVDDAGHGWVTGYYKQSLVLGDQVRDVGEGIGVFVAEFDGQSLPHYGFGDEQDGAWGRGLMTASDGKERVAVTASHQEAISLHDDAPSYTTENYAAGAVVGVMTSSGEHAWSRAVAPTEFGFVSLPGLAFAPTGHLWAGGSFSLANVKTEGTPLVLTNHGGHDAVLVKWAADGKVAWVGSFGDEEEQHIHDIAVDGAGDVWLAGSFAGVMHFDGGSLYAVANDYSNGDMFVVKLDAAGKWKWGRAFGDAEDQSFREIELDDAGEAWLFGNYTGMVKNLGDKTLSGKGMAVAKMGGDGEVLWARDWPCDGYCGVSQAGVDGAGQAVVGVYIDSYATATINEQPFINTSDEYNSVVVKLDRAGLTVWSAEPFPGAVSLDVGPRGEVFVAGDFREKVSFADGAFHLDAGVDDQDIYVAHLRP